MIYNRIDALQYADRWALGRNPMYYDYSKIGGDCTNFISQVLHAGGCTMNYSTDGWFYENGNKKSPSWTGVNFLYRFLIKDKVVGPVVEETGVGKIKIGDIVQLSFQEGNVYNHSLVIVECGNPASISNIKVSTHTTDQYHYPLSDYKWTKIRFLHVVRG
ncbi:MAG: amidase domain-containing protein [Ignavibacteriales bacterium]